MPLNLFGNFSYFFVTFLPNSVRFFFHFLTYPQTVGIQKKMAKILFDFPPVFGNFSIILPRFFAILENL